MVQKSEVEKPSVNQSPPLKLIVKNQALFCEGLKESYITQCSSKEDCSQGIHPRAWDFGDGWRGKGMLRLALPGFREAGRTQKAHVLWPHARSPSPPLIQFFHLENDQTVPVALSFDEKKT